MPSRRGSELFVMATVPDPGITVDFQNPTRRMTLRWITGNTGSPLCQEKALKEMGSAEVECDFLNRLLATLPQHEVPFHCERGDVPNEAIYRDRLGLLQMATTIQHSRPLEEIIPVLQAERLRPRQSDHVEIWFDNVAEDVDTPADPRFAAAFEQVG
ncbi:unnamed protein product, partial [Mesorhabditis spiculigera]